jgi:hypothetical protein
VGLPRPTEGVFTRGHRLGRAPAIIDTDTLDAIRNRIIAVVPVIERFEQDGVRLADGQSLRPDVIICATGYRRGLERWSATSMCWTSGECPWTTVRALPIGGCGSSVSSRVPA